MRLPNGYGSAVKLSGKRRKPYAVRITTSWSEDGNREKKYLGCFKTGQDAIETLADYNENPFDLASRAITFADLFERWQKVKYKDKEIPSEYVSAYKKLAPLYDMPFAEIRKRHIQGVLDSLKVGYSSKSHMKAVCTMMFRYAIDQEIVTTNFASLVELPKNERSEIHKPFTREDLQILWQNKEDFAAKIALILCYTGLRPPELLIMKTANVHLEERYMRGGIKTAAGKNRVIPTAKKSFRSFPKCTIPKTNISFRRTVSRYIKQNSDKDIGTKAKF